MELDQSYYRAFASGVDVSAATIGAYKNYRSTTTNPPRNWEKGKSKWGDWGPTTLSWFLDPPYAFSMSYDVPINAQHRSEPQSRRPL